jgi:hypothetical protein
MSPSHNHYIQIQTFCNTYSPKTFMTFSFCQLLNYQQLKEKEKCISKMILSQLSLECNAWGEIVFEASRIGLG